MWIFFVDSWFSGWWISDCWLWVFFRFFKFFYRLWFFVGLNFRGLRISYLTNFVDDDIFRFLGGFHFFFKFKYDFIQSTFFFFQCYNYRIWFWKNFTVRFHENNWNIAIKLIQCSVVWVRKLFKCVKWQNFSILKNYVLLCRKKKLQSDWYVIIKDTNECIFNIKRLTIIYCLINQQKKSLLSALERFSRIFFTTRVRYLKIFQKWLKTSNVF